MSPRTFEIRRLQAEDISTFTALIETFNVVFDEESKIGTETQLTRLLNDTHFLVLAALIDGQVVAGLTAYELPMYYSDASEVFLYDLAVQPEYQKMGIGRGLLQALKEYCRENGMQTFFVMAHVEDEDAIEFYRATGGKSEEVINFLYETDEQE